MPKEATFAEIVPISAATGDNVDRLERAISDRLPEGQPLYPLDYLTDQPERFFVAEIVREKLLQFMFAESPVLERGCRRLVRGGCSIQ